MQAGIASFAAKGIGDTKHADLARACEVSVPAVFSYFPNRGVLVTSILNEVGTRVIGRVIEGATRIDDPTVRLRATAQLYSELALDEPDTIKVWLMWSMHFAPEIQAHYHEFESFMIEEIAEMIQAGAANHDPGQDIHDRARVVIASSAFLARMIFDGVSQQRRDLFVEHVMAAALTDLSIEN